MRRPRWMAALLTVVIVLTSTLLGRGSTLHAERARGGPHAVLRADPAYFPVHVSAPDARQGLGVQSASFVVTFIGGWTTEAREAFQYAVDIWAGQLNSPQPIEVRAYWDELGTGILGAAGPLDYYRNFSHAPRTGTWYAIALANALADQDLNDSDGWDSDDDGFDADAEIVAVFNSAFSKWSFGTDGNPGVGQYDFASVVLHELCHGLGFTGSMDVGPDGRGHWGDGTPDPDPDAFDWFLENGVNQSLLSAFANHSLALGSQLTGGGGGVFFDGTNSRSANGGAPVALYAPSTWNGGSSIYHLGESYNGTPNALMTYSLSSGESAHDAGNVTRGILLDVGWDLVTQPDLSIVTRIVGPVAPAPGEPVTLALSVRNGGVFAASGVVVTNTLAAEIVSPSYEWSASLAGIAHAGGTTYVWSLPDLAVGASGVITVHGTLDGSLSSDYAIWNTSAIDSADGDEDTSNNQSTVLVGGHRGYLPVALRN